MPVTKRLATRCTLLFLFIGVLCTATHQAHASLGFQAISPDELKMTSDPQAPGAPAIILFRQVDRDDNIHTPHEDNYFRIKILTEEGRKHADIEIPFLKENENVVALKARTIRPDGSVANFDGKVFEKYLLKGRLEGRQLKVLAKTFTLPDVQVGSIIEYSYTIDYGEYTLFNSQWVLSDELFTKKAVFTLKPFNDDKDGGTWIRTTLPQASESRIERAGKLKLSDTGDLEGKLSITYVGLEAMYRRLEEQHADEAARKKYLEDGLKEQIEAGTEVDLTNKPDWTSSETPLVAEFDLKIPGWASGSGRRVMIPAAIFTAGEKNVFDHAQRAYAIYFEYPHLKADDVTVELPAGWQVSSVPPPQNQDGHVILYTLKVDQSPGTVRLTRKFTVDFMMLEAKYYTALRNFFQVVRTGDGEQIVLQPGEIHASN
ncbi:MAG TPA: DUF3857 domain-containing protein [Terriglobales bacterium]|jgi:hypothetical protein|nr:DUF3857 domain-containing protein [Terriglobales bacterium]